MEESEHIISPLWNVTVINNPIKSGATRLCLGRRCWNDYWEAGGLPRLPELTRCCVAEHCFSVSVTSCARGVVGQINRSTGPLHHPCREQRRTALKDFLPVFKTSAFFYTHVYHTLQRSLCFFLFLQRSFTPLPGSLAHDSGGDTGAVVPLAGSSALRGSGQLGCHYAGPTLPVAPHQGVWAGFYRLAEGCRDAQSSVSPGVARGATDAPSSWLGCGGCCTPTQELLLMGFSWMWTEVTHQCRA